VNKTRMVVSVGLALGATTLMASACTSRHVAPVPSPSLAVPSTATSSAASGAAAVQAAVAAYRNMWVAYDAAVQVPDPGDPNLARYATGDALRTLVSGLQSLKDKGLKGTGTVAVSPQVTAVSPAEAPNHVSLRDCLNDAASHVVRASAGPAYSDPPGGKHLTLADVERQADGSWKVTGFGVRAVGTC